MKGRRANARACNQHQLNWEVLGLDGAGATTVLVSGVAETVGGFTLGVAENLWFLC